MFHYLSYLPFYEALLEAVWIFLTNSKLDAFDMDSLPINSVQNITDLYFTINLVILTNPRPWK